MLGRPRGKEKMPWTPLSSHMLVSLPCGSRSNRTSGSMGSWKGKIGRPMVDFEFPQAEVPPLAHSSSAVIPDNSTLRFIARAPTRDDVAELRTRVKACFESVKSSRLRNPISSFTRFFQRGCPCYRMQASHQSRNRIRRPRSERCTGCVYLTAWGLRNQKAQAVSLGRTFASFFKEQYKGDTYPVDFGASTDFVRIDPVLAAPPS